MSEHFLEVKGFLGIDNTSPQTSISKARKTGIFFYEIDNIDIDDDLKPHRRSGPATRVYSGTGVRSIWANDKIFLFAEGTNFKRLNDDNTATILLASVDKDDDFTYVGHGDIVYFSNNTIVGYVDSNTRTCSPFPTPTEQYKRRMVGGHILEFFNSRLFAAHGSIVFYSDATIPTRMDIRKNGVAFLSRITLLKGLDKGMYISDSDGVYFEEGTDPTIWTERKVLDVPAIEGMSAVAVTLNAKTGQMRKVCYFMTKEGPYAGYENGILVPQQQGLFHIDGLESGTAIIKKGTYQQFITIGKYQAASGESTGEFRLPVMTTTARSANGSLSQSPSQSPSSSPSQSPSRSPSASPSVSPST